MSNNNNNNNDKKYSEVCSKPEGQFCSYWNEKYIELEKENRKIKNAARRIGEALERYLAHQNVCWKNLRGEDEEDLGYLCSELSTINRLAKRIIGD